MLIRRPAIIGLLTGVGVVAASALFSLIGSTSSNAVARSDRFAIDAQPALRFCRLTVEDGEQYALLELRNPTSQTLYFRGYGPKCPQQWYERQSSGTWKDSGWHWCGTGMELRELAAGQSFEFQVSSADFENWGEPNDDDQEITFGPMRVTIAFGFTQNAIQTRLTSEPFQFASTGQR